MPGSPRQNTDKRVRKMQGTENATMLLGRVLLSLLFLIGGTIKLLGPAATQAMFVKRGLPAQPSRPAPSGRPRSAAPSRPKRPAKCRQVLRGDLPGALAYCRGRYRHPLIPIPPAGGAEFV